MESVSSAAGGSCCGMSPLVGSAILSLGSRRCVCRAGALSVLLGLFIRRLSSEAGLIEPG